MKRKGRERIGEQVHAIQAIGYDLCASARTTMKTARS